MKEKVMKSKKLLKASLALSLVFGSIVPTVVSASDFDTNDTNNISTKSQNEEISQDVVEKADHFVEVQNNQFVLSKDAENKFDDSEIYSIKKLISESIHRLDMIIRKSIRVINRLK